MRSLSGGVTAPGHDDHVVTAAALGDRHTRRIRSPSSAVRSLAECTAMSARPSTIALSTSEVNRALAHRSGRTDADHGPRWW